MPRARICSVKGGRIRAVCSRCAKVKYVPVSPGLKKKNVRCDCGLSTLYSLNYRNHIRESASGKALAFLSNGREVPVYLSDVSIGGIGFLLSPQHARQITGDQDIILKYRGESGAMVQRRLRVKSVVSTRVGAQFTDRKEISQIL